MALKDRDALGADDKEHYRNNEATPGEVWVADLVNRKLLTTITTPEPTLSAAMSPDGSSVYVAMEPTNFDKQTHTDNEMVMIDTLTNTIGAVISFPNGFFGLDKVVVSPNGRHVYATSNGPNVAIIDAITNTYSALIRPLLIVVSARGRDRTGEIEAPVRKVDFNSDFRACTAPLAPSAAAWASIRSNASWFA